MTDTTRFSGKTVIITGGGSGIGLATAYDVAAEGGDVTTAAAIRDTHARTGRLDAFRTAAVAGDPMRRFGDSNEAAALVAFLMSGEAPYINGTAMTIDGGQTEAFM